MAFIHGKSATVLFGVYDLSAYLNNASFSGSVETGETTAFGNASKTYVVGLKDGTVSLQGMFDGAAGAVDAIMSTALGAANTVTTIHPQSAATIGNRALMSQGDQTSYEITTPVADVVSVSAELQADGGVDTGVLLGELTSRTTTTNSSSVDNSASSANGGVAHLHVTANTRNGATTIKVQHSTDNSTWVDLVTFTSVGISSTTSERVVVASGTTVNRYLRHQLTVAGTTGAITSTVSFARR